MTVAITVACTDDWAVLQWLLCGRAAAADHLANDIRVEAHGRTTFGRTDALDLFALHPLALSSEAQVLVARQAIVVLCDTADGRTVGALGDLVDGVSPPLGRRRHGRGCHRRARRAGGPRRLHEPVAPALPGRRDRPPGSARRRLAACRRARQRRAGRAANAARGQQQPGLGDARLRQWRVGGRAVPLARASRHAARQAHDRLALALAVAGVQGQGHRPDARVYQRLAVSDPLPEPAPVPF